MAVLFSFEGVAVAFADREVLAEVDLVIPEGGCTVLVGPSGSGKSTLLRLCNRLEAPAAGVVRFRGEDVASLDPLRHRRRVGMVFQRPIAFGGSVLDNLRVAQPALTTGDAAAALEEVGLPAPPRRSSPAPPTRCAPDQSRGSGDPLLHRSTS